MDERASRAAEVTAVAAVTVAVSECSRLAGDPRITRRARRLRRRLAAAIDPVVVRHGAVDLAVVVRDLDGEPVDGLVVVTPATVVVAHRRRRHHTETMLVRRSSIAAVSVSAGPDGRSSDVELTTAGGVTRFSVVGRTAALDDLLREVLSPRRG